ncbi:MAG TPA: hypothetical protein VIM51_12725 [Desulfosporosinus sp.]
MSKTEMASLACKILGIYIIIQGINVFSSVLLFAPTPAPDQMAHENFVNIIFSLVYFIFGVLLLFFSDKLSAVMVTGGTHTKEVAGIEVSDIQRVAFSVLGLYFMGSSLPKLVSTLTSAMRALPNSFTGFILLGSVGIITEFIIGLGIFLGSQGLVSFLNNMRTMGLKKEDDNVENK